MTNYADIKKNNYGWVTKKALEEVVYLSMFEDGEGNLLSDSKDKDFYFEGSDSLGWFVLGWYSHGDELNFGVNEDKVKVIKRKEKFIITKLL